ncbi:2-hydroxyacyl-CoA dehydratase family protein [Pseudobutyrivibrio xylanivorans]|uniref:Benzoyl-CoA reductase/2-hydroxyglutaryl-CoA dehydratase subunit, BcrC/BadD/HgdB n=1 Tax=Pseudobutyrivibrio xylanivorans TaxID=185007 RepID=A0A1G5S3Z0_PSEXY|nr:2-hydroxyacyl-CoA dehydratase family protein [Pseudobutyrivibrio xylanivorans]SCZ80471.1 Benzoyl-CoA reductase/2-hydroxyglutaryl-CoA dehydratase subunit, BcrC/BadD/HgdB [Pseudobutyrivibrio xylanivorans]
MKDLKHLYYFEKLLEDSYNDLCRQAQAEGNKAIGHVCFQIPEPLLNLPGCFSTRLRAPRTGSIEMGTYYMSSTLCEACRAYLERAIEGGFNFLDCILAPDACAQMNRCVENIERLKTNPKDSFFVTYADVPMKSDETALKHYVKQMRIRVLEPLQKNFGIDISDEALRKSVEEQNEISRLITAIGEYRKYESPRITGYEFAVLCLATYCCPKYLLKEKLQETLDELKTREPDPAGKYRIRVVMVGSEIDDPEFIQLAEECGALVVADRFCFGSLPGRQEIILNDEEDVLTQICRTYLQWGKCPRFFNQDKIMERRDYVDQLAKEYHADGLIYEQIKFCDYWGYERASAFHIMEEEYGYPVLSVDRPYAVRSSGQLRTRIQAFVERVEMKKLAEAKAERRAQ